MYMQADVSITTGWVLQSETSATFFPSIEVINNRSFKAAIHFDSFNSGVMVRTILKRS